MAEWLVNFHLEQLPEGGYLATCESIPGLIAQGRTVTEALAPAERLPVARLLGETGVTPPLPSQAS